MSREHPHMTVQSSCLHVPIKSHTEAPDKEHPWGVGVHLCTELTGVSNRSSPLPELHPHVKGQHPSAVDRPSSEFSHQQKHLQRGLYSACPKLNRVKEKTPAEPLDFVLCDVSRHKSPTAGALPKQQPRGTRR